MMPTVAVVRLTEDTTKVEFVRLTEDTTKVEFVRLTEDTTKVEFVRKLFRIEETRAEKTTTFHGS